MLITSVVNISWHHVVSTIQEENGKSKKTKPACALVSALQNVKVSLKLAEWCRLRLLSPIHLYSYHVAMKSSTSIRPFFGSFAEGFGIAAV